MILHFFEGGSVALSQLICDTGCIIIVGYCNLQVLVLLLCLPAVFQARSVIWQTDKHLISCTYSINYCDGTEAELLGSSLRVTFYYPSLHFFSSKDNISVTVLFVIINFLKFFYYFFLNFFFPLKDLLDKCISVPSDRMILTFHCFVTKLFWHFNTLS